MCGTFLPSLHRGEGERLPSILVLSPQPVRGSSGGGGGGRIPAGSILVSVLRLLKRTRGGREEACSPPPPSFPPLCRRWFFFAPPPLRSTSSFWSSSASEGAGRFTVPSLLPSFHLPPLVCESECLLHLRSDFQVGSVGGVSLHSQEEGNVNKIKAETNPLLPTLEKIQPWSQPLHQKNTKSHLSPNSCGTSSLAYHFPLHHPDFFCFIFFCQEPRSDCGTVVERVRETENFPLPSRENTPGG